MHQVAEFLLQFIKKVIFRFYSRN